MKKDNAKKEKTYTESQVTVILEDINSKIDAIGDGHKLLNEKFDGMKSAFERISVGVEKIDLRLIKAEKDIAKNTEDIATISARLDHIQQDIHLIKEDFSKRLTLIETKVSALSDR